jgi:hypothetical protein
MTFTAIWLPDGDRGRHHVALALGDVTTISAVFPAAVPADCPHFVAGYEAWIDAAEHTGLDPQRDITESTFDYTTVSEDADEDTTCAALLVLGTWYLLIRDSDTVRAVHATPAGPGRFARP